VVFSPEIGLPPHGSRRAADCVCERARPAGARADGRRGALEPAQGHRSSCSVGEALAKSMRARGPWRCVRRASERPRPYGHRPRLNSERARPSHRPRSNPHPGKRADDRRRGDLLDLHEGAAALESRARQSHPHRVRPQAASHPDYEIDHLIPLGIGGVDDDAISGQSPGAESSQRECGAEGRAGLRDLVCSGTLDVREAQQTIADDWVTEYRRYVGGE
jgi:hypothetical protein